MGGGAALARAIASDPLLPAATGAAPQPRCNLFLVVDRNYCALLHLEYVAAECRFDCSDGALRAGRSLGTTLGSNAARVWQNTGLE